MLTGSSCFLCGILLIGHAHAIGERVMLIRQVNTLCGFQLIEYLDSRNKKTWLVLTSQQLIIQAVQYCAGEEIMPCNRV